MFSSAPNGQSQSAASGSSRDGYLAQRQARARRFAALCGFALVAALAGLASSVVLAEPQGDGQNRSANVADAPAEPGPVYDGAGRATFPVHEATHTLAGEEGERDLPVRVYLPTPGEGADLWTGPRPGDHVAAGGDVADTERGDAAGDRGSGVPVIVFSHGLGGSNEAFPKAARLWASHGYVVVLPTHADSLRYAENRRRLLTGRRGDGAERPSQAERFAQRALDQTRILDRFDELCDAIPELSSLRAGFGVDLNNVATAGHSFGAQTSQLVAGAELRTDIGAPVRAADPRVRACAPISPQAIGSAGFFPGSWSALDLPVFIVTGTHDKAVDGATPEQREEGFAAMPGGDKHLLVIDDAHHSSFQDKPGGMSRRFERRFYERMGVPYSDNDAERDSAIALHTRTVLLAFFDAYLRGDDDAIAYLRGDGPGHAGGSTGRFERK
jgi:predicted dienelactone hydrolase